MNIIKSNNGFPHSWRAGRVEQLIRNIIENKAVEQLTVDTVMLINPIWLADRNLEQEIQDANPDVIICCNFVDPIIIQVEETIKASGRPYIIIGNHGDYRIDFWAMACDLNFRSYTDDELTLNPQAKKFISHNRKPHAHRRILVNALLHSDVVDSGYISLGYENNALMIDSEFTADQGINDAMPDRNPIKNDIYSLGDIDVWKDSYLCLVTETTFGTADSRNFFISENTWKPVLGLRPFFVYGQPELRKYLKAQGFDIFDDIINYDQLAEWASEADYANLAIETIRQMSTNQYPLIYSRLCRNKNKFQQYVYQQWDRLLKLNLKENLHD